MNNNCECQLFLLLVFGLRVVSMEQNGCKKIEETKGLIPTSEPIPIYIFFSNKRSPPRAKLKPLQLKEGEVNASLTLYKVKTSYFICQLRVSIIFDSAMATTNLMSISPEIRLFDIILYFEQFISFLACIIDCAFIFVIS